MISLVIDKIENAPLYYGLGERFRKALEWLAAVDPSTLSPGEKVPIDGENVYGLLFQVDTLAPDAAEDAVVPLCFLSSIKQAAATHSTAATAHSTHNRILVMRFKRDTS